MMSEKEYCTKCDDCRFIATDDDASPWWVWETIPYRPVATGPAAKRIPCPECNPEGELPYVRPVGR